MIYLAEFFIVWVVILIVLMIASGGGDFLMLWVCSVIGAGVIYGLIRGTVWAIKTIWMYHS